MVRLCRRARAPQPAPHRGERPGRRERRRLLRSAGAIRAGAAAGAATARQRPVDNDKNVRAGRIAGAEGHAQRARVLERRAARVAIVERPREPWRLQMNLSTQRRSGNMVVRLDQAVVERGVFVLGPFDVELRWRDRMALLGPNGSGKSTLLDAMVGRLPLRRGRRREGARAIFGELRQDRRAGDGEIPMLDGFMRDAGLTASQGRTLLATFDLGPDDVLRPASELSPGERTRATLAALMARGTNCLVLDEPTNHLDLAAVEELEAALTAFDGTLVIATHDRALLQEIGITRTLDVAALHRTTA